MEAPVLVVDDAAKLGAALSPIRRRVLDELGDEGSATTLAERLGLTRQKVNYHLRGLEKAGLVELSEKRQRRGFTERVYRPSAAAFVVDPGVIGTRTVEPSKLRDRFSSAYLLSVAAKLVNDVAVLRQRASKAGKKLLTQTMTAEIRFERPADFEAFTEELTEEIARLVDKHGAKVSGRGRTYRFVLGAHPRRSRE